jgi:hypothetical protein
MEGQTGIGFSSQSFSSLEVCSLLSLTSCCVGDDIASGSQPYFVPPHIVDILCDISHLHRLAFPILSQPIVRQRGVRSSYQRLSLETKCLDSLVPKGNRSHERGVVGLLIVLPAVPSSSPTRTSWTNKWEDTVAPYVLRHILTTYPSIAQYTNDLLTLTALIRL